MDSSLQHNPGLKEVGFYERIEVIKNKMHTYLKFAKQTIIMAALGVLSGVQGIIFLPIITKILGAQNYGIWVQVQITMGLLVPLTFFGLGEALGRFLPGEKDVKKIQEGIYSSLVFVVCVNVMLALLLVVFSGSLAVFLGFEPIFVKLLSWLIIFEGANAVFLTAVLFKREIGKYFWFAVLKMFGETALVVLAILFGYGLYGSVLAFLLIRIIVFFMLFIYVVRKYGIKFPDFSLLKPYMKFGLPTMTNGLAYGAITSADRYIIGFFLGILFVGYYAPAYSLGMLLLFFILPIMSLLNIVLPKLFDDNDLPAVKSHLSHSLKYFLLLMIPAVLGLSVLARQLLTIFSTKEIAAHAHAVVPFIAASMLAYGLIMFFLTMLSLLKKTKVIAAIWVVAAMVNITLNLIFTPKFGIIAAAIITLISYLCALVLMWYSAFREFQFKIDWNFIAKSLAASVLMALGIIWFGPAGLLGVIMAIVLGAVAYGILIFLLGGIGKKEIIFLKNLMGFMPDKI